MSATRTSRRRFIGATSVALSAPLAAFGATVAAAAPPSSRPSPDDVRAIRLLMHEHALRLEAGAIPGVRRILSDDFGVHDRVAVAVDGHTATAALPCTAETETAIGPDCPLVEMARQQGGGIVTASERGVLEYSLTKQDDTWTVAHAAYRRQQSPP